ncbi:hypothetical protein GCM10007424_26740 [Flavobacterium suaedae]|uniref:GIY-YIG nuclease family protein n=1 Tax=Flavobacterium suaedae TaxID=1767027 RepID=A0ABQ1K2Q8_9FLAO|nr:hypothetical protein [Flavobacterium suaedae]GGB85349.1 hypothetical protein GCM10007424_26740 [Flavobacterium suaedae]
MVPHGLAIYNYQNRGKTIYFNGKGFKSCKGAGIQGNYYDSETGDEYWISGVKKDMTDRHWAGGGKIFIEKRAVKNYLTEIGISSLNISDYELVDIITEVPKERLYEMENEVTEAPLFDDNIHFKQPPELTINEIEYLIQLLEQDEKEAVYNKGRRTIKQKRLLLEEEYRKRLINNG